MVFGEAFSGIIVGWMVRMIEGLRLLVKSHGRGSF